MKLKLTKCLLFASLFNLSGCDSFASLFLPDEDDSSGAIMIVRQVIDSSYLYEALTCTDIDENYECSDSDNIKETNRTGEIYITDSEQTVLAKIIIGKTISSDPFSATKDNYELIGLPNTKYVTPFTTYAYLSNQDISDVAISLGMAEDALSVNYVNDSNSAVFIQALARSFILRFNKEGISYYMENPNATSNLGLELRQINRELLLLKSEGKDLSTVVIEPEG